MRLLQKPVQFCDWTFERPITCRCGAVFEVDKEDLYRGRFAIFVICPCCNKPHGVEDGLENLPHSIKDGIQKWESTDKPSDRTYVKNFAFICIFIFLSVISYIHLR